MGNRIRLSMVTSGWWFLWILSLTTTKTATTATAKYINVYGNELQRCSSSGTALTGYTRTGYCVEQSDDTGSHHICINLNSTTGGNFCDVTGQSNWCSSTDMTCDEGENNDQQQDPQDEDDEDNEEQDATSTTCAIQNWCVCQWAFASYIQKAGGCDEIQEIQCNAINMEALRAYQSTSGDSYKQAYQCLVERCHLSSQTNVFTKELRQNPAAVTGWRWLAAAGFMMALAGTIYSTLRQRNSNQPYYDCSLSSLGVVTPAVSNNKNDALLPMEDGADVIVR